LIISYYGGLDVSIELPLVDYNIDSLSIRGNINVIMCKKMPKVTLAIINNASAKMVEKCPNLRELYLYGEISYLPAYNLRLKELKGAQTDILRVVVCLKPQ